MGRALRIIAVLAAAVLMSACYGPFYYGPPWPGYPRVDGGAVYYRLDCRVNFFELPQDPLVYRNVYCPRVRGYNSRIPGPLSPPY